MKRKFGDVISGSVEEYRSLSQCACLSFSSPSAHDVLTGPRVRQMSTMAACGAGGNGGDGNKKQCKAPTDNLDINNSVTASTDRRLSR